MLLIYLSIVKIGYICLQTEIRVHGDHESGCFTGQRLVPTKGDNRCADLSMR